MNKLLACRYLSLVTCMIFTCDAATTLAGCDHVNARPFTRASAVRAPARCVCHASNSSVIQLAWGHGIAVTEFALRYTCNSLGQLYVAFMVAGVGAGRTMQAGGLITELMTLLFAWRIPALLSYREAGPPEEVGSAGQPAVAISAAVDLSWELDHDGEQGLETGHEKLSE